VGFFRTLLVFALGAGVALGSQYALRNREASEEAPHGPVVSANLPDDPGDPPVVWMEGVIQGVDGSGLALREGQGPTVDIRRFEEGATHFLQLSDGVWRELTAAEVGSIQAGQSVCVETLLDRRTFFALRVFVGARCGPA
jgi:hypothetical protein